MRKGSPRNRSLAPVCSKRSVASRSRASSSRDRASAPSCIPISRPSTRRALRPAATRARVRSAWPTDRASRRCRSTLRPVRHRRRRIEGERPSPLTSWSRRRPRAPRSRWRAGASSSSSSTSSSSRGGATRSTSWSSSTSGMGGSAEIPCSSRAVAMRARVSSLPSASPMRRHRRRRVVEVRPRRRTPWRTASKAASTSSERAGIRSPMSMSASGGSIPSFSSSGAIRARNRVPQRRASPIPPIMRTSDADSSPSARAVCSRMWNTPFWRRAPPCTITDPVSTKASWALS